MFLHRDKTKYVFLTMATVCFLAILAIIFLFLQYLQLKKEENWEVVKISKNYEAQDIVIFSPKANEKVHPPLEIKGKARGPWFFEATFPVRLLNNQGEELATSYVQALDEWMTEDFVPFEGEISFISKKESGGELVFRKANPSGLPEYDKEFRLPIQLAPAETIKVKVYFNNNRMDPEFSCNKVFPTEREILKTQAVARAALQELLKGPTNREKSEGFFTSISPGVGIQSLAIENRVAKVDFDEQLEYQVGGSCKVSAIRAQITETLKQFATVDSVIISINGRTEDILQP